MSVPAVFKVANAALELIGTGTLILSKLNARQQERAAQGRELTQVDLAALMDEGDVKAALQKVRLAAAEVARAQSG